MKELHRSCHRLVISGLLGASLCYGLHTDITMTAGQPAEPLFHEPLLTGKTISETLPLYFWHTATKLNFGDVLSIKVVERMLGHRVQACSGKYAGKKLLAIGSILTKALTGDVVWGSGIKNKNLPKSAYNFTALDVRSVRGPLTRQLLREMFNVESPEVYGDPALLVPFLFPELQKAEHPQYEYLVIPHYKDNHLFPKDKFPNVVYATDPWDEVVKAIINSKLVISGSMHGIIIAEAYGIPARFLRITYDEPIFKYIDYYAGTGRCYFKAARSVEDALILGGEPPMKCDLKALYNAFPFELWPDAQIKEFNG